MTLLKLISLVCLLLLLTTGASHAQTGVTGKWSGIVKVTEVSSGPIGSYERVVSTVFRDNVGTGQVTETSKRLINGTVVCEGSCSGSGAAILNEVIVEKEDGVYRIHAISPAYACDFTGSICEFPHADMHPTDLIISDQPLVNNNVLAGSHTTSSTLALNTTYSQTITWNLSRNSDSDPLLIVTPENYDNWLPEPGLNELVKGTSIKINLKLVDANGRPLTKKVKSFELRLNSTSTEPGITINAPLHPASTLPDLRFLPQANTAIGEEFQWAKIESVNGVSGSILIGAFDGGGYTTLTAEAILEDENRIEGHLLIPAGETEIRIPKRTSGSNIGEAWLVLNGNPNDDYDIESSNGNNNNGDGLSAYEEYRGIMLQGTFKRLSPKKKELGIWMKKAESQIFSRGINLFRTACDLEVILFYDNEIGADRKFNRNFKTANIYQQYVLKLVKDNCPENVYGQNRPTNVTNKVPRMSEQVVVDVDKLNSLYAYYRLNRIATLNTEQEELANTTAHEIAHGVRISHHGMDYGIKDKKITTPHPLIVILDKNSDTIKFRPKPLDGFIGRAGNQTSGNLNCIMAYTDYYSWAINITGNRIIYAEVPAVPMGIVFCQDPTGTKFNARPNYFYDASEGNCLGKMKLKD